MASKMLLRLATNVRPSIASCRVRARTYATSTTRPAAPTRAYAPKVPAAKVSTSAGENVIPPEVDAYASQPAESVPSSSALSQSSSAPAPTVDFADPTSIGGSPLDPSSPDWSKSYFGLSTQPFTKEAAEALQAPVDPLDIEIKPDGLIYLPEIKYRRVLNKAFGPGGWGLAPRSETAVGARNVSREYALVCLGRLVGIARGEQEYFDPNGIPTATEACKSNALMRCCKDLGIASELWDPRFIREFKQKYCVEVFVEDLRTKKKKKLWRRKDQPPFEYPYKE